MKKSAILIQKFWRRYKTQKNYKIIRQGFLRLQSSIRSRKLTNNFTKFRLCIIHFQVKICTGNIIKVLVLL